MVGSAVGKGRRSTAHRLSAGAGQARSTRGQTRAAPSSPTDDDTIDPRLENALERAGHPYYDAKADQAAQRRYYSGLRPSRDPAELYNQLHDLVTRTHSHKLGYEPKRDLFPWVDLRPSLRLQSIYSTVPIQTGDPARVRPAADAHSTEPAPAKPTRKGRKGRHTGKAEKRMGKLQKLEDQADSWAKALAGAPMDAVELAQRIAQAETQRYFNCEHMIPRSWFDDRSPMASDLHHLFTCENNCNSVRSSAMMVENESYEGTPGDLCGWVSQDISRFEPAAGKGAVARATLYFLVRYPGKVGNREGQYGAEDIATLQQWSREHPPTLYERHRNQAIEELQGNRNPFIDHPEWADQIDLGRALGRPPRSRRR
ncbi:MAG: endonuclease [Armatimonadetes bacterium]|nr:endonuclease [Armatimonadota bacterium]